MRLISIFPRGLKSKEYGKLVLSFVEKRLSLFDDDVFMKLKRHTREAVLKRTMSALGRSSRKLRRILAIFAFEILILMRLDVEKSRLLNKVSGSRISTRILSMNDIIILSRCVVFCVSLAFNYCVSE